MPWIVNATDTSGYFRANFFPRILHYKKHAQALVEEARRKGATNITMRKQCGTSTPRRST